MKVVLDENMSPRIARALAAFFDGEHEVIYLRERFGPGVTDMEWMRTLSSEGPWVVISADRRITRSKAEYSVFRSSRFIGFFLARGLQKAPIRKQLERLLVVWDDIETFVARVESGAVFEVRLSGRLAQLRV